MFSKSRVAGSRVADAAAAREGRQAVRVSASTRDMKKILQDKRDEQIKRLQERRLLPPDYQSRAVRERMNRARVFYDTGVFKRDELKGFAPNTLESTLAKTVPVDVEGSRIGWMPLGEDWPGYKFFETVQSGSEYLSMQERIRARSKIYYSPSMVYRFGGFNNSVVDYESPIQADIFTIAGMQFENTLLDYRLFIIDPYQNEEEYDKVYSKLINKDPSAKSRYNFIAPDLGLYLKRDPKTGEFYQTFNFIFGMQNTVILDRDAYHDALVRSFTLLFSAAEKTASSDKKIYFKLPFIGMGFFAKINGEYDIRKQLAPIYITALIDTLRKYTFSHLDTIELPYFDEDIATIVDIFFYESHSTTVNGVTVNFTDHVDLLDFTRVDLSEFRICVANPGDANAYPGNEYGPSNDRPTSVESMIGNHTDIRYLQTVANPELLDMDSWIGVNIKSNSYDYLHLSDDLVAVADQAKQLMLHPQRCSALVPLSFYSYRSGLSFLSKSTPAGDKRENKSPSASNDYLGLD